ncbi:MAG TPA: hypothetical protein VF800_22655 [Telluria sp.]|jgi:hypothetical protein
MLKPAIIYPLTAMIAALCSACTVPYVAPASGPVARLRLVDVSPNPDARISVFGQPSCNDTPATLTNFGSDSSSVDPVLMQNLDMPMQVTKKKNTEILIPAAASYNVRLYAAKSGMGGNGNCIVDVQFSPHENGNYQIDVADIWTTCEMKVFNIEKNDTGTGYIKIPHPGVRPKKCS